MSLEIWDKLASENSIHAALAAVDEEHERRKSESDISLLKKELRDGVILDLGCGYGRIAKYLLPERKFSKYIGLDGSEKMLSLFRSRYGAQGLEQKTPLLLILGDIKNIPLQDKSVDNVIVSSVFLHNTKIDTRNSLLEIRRILKDGGKLILLSNFPNKRSIMGLQGTIYLACLRLLGRERNGPVRYFSKSEVEELLSSFRKVSIRKTGFSILPSRILILPAPLNKIYRDILRNPGNKFFKKILTPFAQKTSCEWFDAICEK